MPPCYWQRSGKYSSSCSSWWLHGLLTASGIHDSTTHLPVRCLFPSRPTAVLHFMAGLSLLQAPQWLRAQQRTDGCPFQFKMPLPNPQRWPNESCQRLWPWETFSSLPGRPSQGWLRAQDLWVVALISFLRTSQFNEIVLCKYKHIETQFTHLNVRGGENRFRPQRHYDGDVGKEK